MNPPVKTISADKARAAWGESMPDWIAALAAECDRTSIAAAAGRIGISRTAGSLVLAGKYPAKTDAVEREVRAVLMNTTVACPVIGEMSVLACQDHQKAEWSPRRAMIQAACAVCPHRPKGEIA
jgi:hypothetical protein